MHIVCMGGSFRDRVTATLQLELLGTPSIEVGGAPLEGWRYGKAEALLYYLAVTGRPHSRESLAALLWSDVPEEVARTNLRTVLSTLRAGLVTRSGSRTRML